jgi:hypothetical protein
MNVVKRIIDPGASRQTDPVYNRHIRFANSALDIYLQYSVNVSKTIVQQASPTAGNYRWPSAIFSSFIDPPGNIPTVF